LVAATWLSYRSSFQGVFLFDDDEAIGNNPTIRQLWPITAPLAPLRDTPTAGRPLVNLSFAINYAWGGLDPFGYHVLNLVIHMAAGLTLFGLVRRTLANARPQAPFGADGPFLAGAAALLWLVHPLQTESVTYIVQRSEALAGLCYLLTLYGTVRSLDAPRTRAWQAAAVLACAAGMACKEIVATAPLMVLLYDRIYGGRAFGDVLRRRGGLYIGLAATWGVLVALNLGGPRADSVGYRNGVGAWLYALNQCRALTTYLRLSFWPSPLLIDYGGVAQLTGRDVAAEGAVVLALLAAVLLALRYRPTIGFLGLWFFIILGPTSSIVPILTEVAAERRMYLPLAAVVVLMVVGGYGLLGLSSDTARGASVWRRRLALLGVAGVAAALGFGTAARNRVYGRAVTMWEDVVRQQPNNGRAQTNLGQALAAAGRTEEAIACYERALRAAPNSYKIHSNLGAALVEQGRFDEAMGHYLLALQDQPNAYLVQNNIGDLLIRQGRFTEALPHLEEALRLRPDHADSANNMGRVLMHLGRWADAKPYLEKAVANDPASYMAYSNLGIVLDRAGDHKKAAEMHQAALRIHPGFAEGYNNLGFSYREAGRLDLAEQCFRQAIRLNPGYTEALRNLGGTLAKQGRTEEAIRALEASLRIAPDDPQTQAALEALRRSAASPG
jgi:protein O-mannosyl-transferase